MSTMEFKNAYIMIVVVVLLFGVGLGYQINTWVNGVNDTETALVNDNTNQGEQSPAGVSPQAAPEVYVRSGKVETVSPTAITFSTYTQNSDSTFTKATLTAQVTDATSFSKINLRETQNAPVAITVDDISVGSEVAIQSDVNMYGKTAFTATTVQLHEF